MTSARSITLVASLVLAACGTESVEDLPYDADAHREAVESWRQWRHDQLTRPDGWLSLVGLYWLEPGDNWLGSADDNKLVYDSSGVPPRLGVFRVAGDSVMFIAAEGVSPSVDDEPVESVLAHDGGEGSGPVIAWDTLRWNVMVRQGEFAVRLKDASSVVLTSFESIDNFQLAAEWHRSGRYVGYEPAKIIKVPNVLGTVADVESPGAAVFEIDGKTYRLDLWKDSDDSVNFFTAFGDQSNNESTYGAGRFLWIDAPDDQGRVVVDFNRSYNPPCAFTVFATCPLPPQQNRLPLRIEAGERTFK